MLILVRSKGRERIRVSSFFHANIIYYTPVQLKEANLSYDFILFHTNYKTKCTVTKHFNKLIAARGERHTYPLPHIPQVCIYSCKWNFVEVKSLNVTSLWSGFNLST